VPLEKTALRSQIAEIVQVNLPHESRVRLLFTKHGRLYIAMQPFEGLPESVYTNGVKVITSEAARHDPRIKDTGFISASTAQRSLLGKDVFEILLVQHGKILEGMTSNFYAVKGRTLITAQRGILLGVTRKAVLRLARGQGMSIEYRPPKVTERFDEAFLTSSSRGVVPIVSLDQKAIGQGSVGKWTKILSQAYQAYVKERSEKIIE
jgi:branched-chain amino acid aminotransferase